MLIGLLGMGMIAGVMAAIAAVIAGYPIVIAVAIYAVAGALTVFAMIPILTLAQWLRNMQPGQQHLPG